MTKPKPRTKTPNLETLAAMAEAEAMILGRYLAPGSKEAREKGCSCPVADNEDMRGVKNANWDPMFVISGACSLHRHIFEGWNREVD